MLPKLGQPTVSGSSFIACVDETLNAVLSKYQETLWTLFKEHVIGEGSYGTPQWHWAPATNSNEDVNPPFGRAKTAPAFKLRGSTGAVTEPVRGSVYAAELPDASASPGIEPPTMPDTAEEAPSQEGPLRLTAAALARAYPELPATRSRRRGLGGPQRRTHVQARLDATLRVKDLLALLRRMGLLQHPTLDLLARVESDSGCHVFPESATRPVTSQSQESAGMEPITELGGLGALLADEPPPVTRSKTMPAVGALPFGGAGHPVKDLSPKAALGAPLGLFGAPPSGAGSVLPTPKAVDAPVLFGRMADGLEEPDSDKDQDSAAGTQGLPSQQCEEPVTQEDVVQCDFAISLVEALRFTAESLSVESLPRIRWQAEEDWTPQDERVAAIDYVETELSFVEFGRILLRLANRACQLDPKCERLKLDDQLEGFLRLVFIPALTTPYVPPEKVDPDAAELEQSELGSKRPSKDVPGMLGGVGGGLLQAAADSKDSKDAKDAKGDKKGRQGSKASLGDRKSVALEIQPDVDTEVAELPPEVFFWPGFADNDELEVEAFMAPRWWPEDYEREAADW